MSTIGEYFEGTLIRGINEGIERDDVVSSFQGTPADGSYELPSGGQGAQGDQGPPARPFRWRGDVADPTALTALIPSLTMRHSGYSYRVVSTDDLVYWDGEAMVPFLAAFGGRGPTGAVNNLTIGTVTTGAIGSEMVITITGSPPSQVLNIRLPRGGAGLDGDIGGPGPIRNAPDYDNTITHIDGMVPIWDTVSEKWKPSPYPGFRGPWSLNSASFSSGSNVSAASTTVATIEIPALDVRWRPFIFGHFLVKSVATNGVTQLDGMVRVDSAAGEIVGYGSSPGYGVDFPVIIQPNYGFGATFAPGDTTASIAAGVATTLYVTINRTVGSGSYSYQSSGATLIVYAQPVVGP